jgi:hypothetical protein
VELGYALGLGKPVVLVGERENVFHWCPGVALTLDDEQCLVAAIRLAAASPSPEPHPGDRTESES